jgi:hypothetical protein
MLNHAKPTRNPFDLCGRQSLSRIHQPPKENGLALLTVAGDRLDVV